jgi:hypothetical protein
MNTAFFALPKLPPSNPETVAHTIAHRPISTQIWLHKRHFQP